MVLEQCEIIYLLIQLTDVPTLSMKSLDLLFSALSVKCGEVYLHMHMNLQLNGIIVHFWQLVPIYSPA